MTRSTVAQLSRLSLALAAAMAMAPAFAQSTSAGIAGTVTGANGQPVAGADVTITHVESGTVRHATTDANGRYAAQGLRVGGPYTVVVNGAAGTVAGMTREAQAGFQERVKEWIGGMDFVSRDEFEAVKAMAAAARDENEALAARIAALEAAKSAPAKVSTAKPRAAKAPKGG